MNRQLTTTLISTALGSLILSGSVFAQSGPSDMKVPPATKPAPKTKAVDDRFISIRAKGDDMRVVIASIFDQVNEQFVIESNYRQSLYLNVENLSLSAALTMISNLADVTFEREAGIWYVRNKKKKTAPVAIKKSTDAAAPTMQTRAAQKFVAPAATVNSMKSAGMVTEADKKTALKQRLTVKLQKTNIREVFEEFSTQTGIKVEADATVPNFKIDAFMYNTSLKFALDRVTTAAGLTYTFIDSKTVRVSKA